MHPDIEVVRDLRTTWYVLPKRNLPDLKKFGGGILFTGGLSTAFMIFWMWMPITSSIQLLLDGQLFGVFLLGFGLLGLLGLLPALGLLALGFGLTTNSTHCRLTMTDDGIEVREYAGPFHWTWKRSAKEITGISALKNPKVAHNDHAGRRTIDLPLIKNLVFVTASCTRKKRTIPLIVGYPYEIADGLTAEIEDHLNSCAGRYGAVTQRIKTRWTEGDVDSLDNAPRPEGTRISLERNANDIIIVIPSAGLVKGSKGLIFFAAFWNLFMTGFTVLGIKGLLNDGATGEPLPFYLFIALFWAVGIGMLIGAINMGQKKAAIKVSGRTLYLLRQRPGKLKKDSWTFDALETICVGDSGA